VYVSFFGISFGLILEESSYLSWRMVVEQSIVLGWMYDTDEVVDIYRKFVVQHHRIASYMHTMGANAVDSETSSMHPAS
jgi:hypothetical protein